MSSFKLLSKCLLPTSKPTPRLNIRKSHDLLLRGGFIKQSSSGIYSMLPFGLLVLNKLEKIIDEEMQSVDAQKLSLPCLLSSEAWEKTDRWNSSDVFKLKDRKKSDFLLSPTHEEEITTLVASLVSSYRNLPLRLYQIGRKYRDELRPRSGLLRAREFIMKDLYTFDKDAKSASKTYNQIQEAYSRIFEKIGINYVSALADTGDIGGSNSHEYHILSNIGEDNLLKCNTCNYTANSELAKGVIISSYRPLVYMKKPQRNIIEKYYLDHVLHSLGDDKNGQVHVGTVGKDQKILCLVITPYEWAPNLTKINKNKLIMLKGGFNSLKESEFDKPVEEFEETWILVDNHFNCEPIINGVEVIQGDFRTAKKGDGCLQCHKNSITSPMETYSAIEIGHTFLLGTKYSKPLNAVFTDSNGQQQHIEMGCYGLGVSRLVAAIVDAKNDADGIIWPKSIAPYIACIIPGVSEDPNELKMIKEATQMVYDLAEKQFGKGQVIIDDRDHQIGFKIKDSLLVGYPHMIIIGKRYLIDKHVEIKNREDGTTDRAVVIQLLIRRFQVIIVYELKMKDKTKENSLLRASASTSSSSRSSSNRIRPVLSRSLKFPSKSRILPTTPPRKLIEIQVETLLGQNISLEVFSTCSVADIKQKLFETHGISVETQILIFREQQLEDNSMIGKLGIQEGSIIKLLVHMAGGPLAPLKTKRAISEQDSVLLLLCRQNEELFMLEVHMKDYEKMNATNQLIEMAENASCNLLEVLEMMESEESIGDSRPVSSTYSTVSTSTFLSYLDTKSKSRPSSGNSVSDQSSIGVKKSRPATAISIMRLPVNNSMMVIPKSRPASATVTSTVTFVNTQTNVVEKDPQKLKQAVDEPEHILEEFENMHLPNDDLEPLHATENNMDNQTHSNFIQRTRKIKESFNCNKCQKKLLITQMIKCKCQKSFCSIHRYSDRHDCKYDYKTAGRRELARDNQLVTSDKVLKI